MMMSDPHRNSTSKTRVSLFICKLTQNLSGMNGSTSSYYSC